MTRVDGNGSPRVTPGGESEDIEWLLPELQHALAPRYSVRECVGAGGMSVVFRAFDTRHERDVAIKVVRPGMAATIASDRFLREIRLTARLQHPNIVALFDSGTAGEIVYYVMPFIEGESLRDLLERQRQLPIEVAVQFSRDIAGALEYAHAHGVVHRDIKPENIIVSSDRALIADFGIATALEQVADPVSLTTEGVLIGTTTYMSPEQCSGEKQLDGRTDVYAAGCVLYEMLTGEPPYSGRSPQAIMARHVSERVPDVRVLRPETPPRLRRIVRKALAKSAADRYQSAGAMEKALQAMERSRPGVAGRLIAAAGVVGLSVWAFDALLEPRALPLDRNRVAIFPLAEWGLEGVRAGAGAAIAVVLNAALEHADPLRPLDIQDRLTAEERRDPGAIGADTRRAMARRAGAGFYITGVVQNLGDSITVGLRLYDVEGDSLLSQRSVRGSPNTPLHRLGLDAILELLPSLVDPGRTIDLTPLRDRDAGAVALFIQGERSYRRSVFPEALRFYRRALSADSLLVLAAIKGALAAYWDDHHAAAELAQYAATRSSLLPPRYAAFARGLAAFSAGKADSAEASMHAALELAPGWPEALYQLAEIRHHLVPIQSSLDSLAEPALRAAVMSDSGFSPPLIHLSEIIIRKGGLDEAGRLIERLHTMRPATELISHLRLMHRCVAEGAERYKWEREVVARPEAVLRAGRVLAVAGAELPCAESAFRAVLLHGPDNLAYGAAFGLQNVLAAQGRSEELVAVVDSVLNASRLQALMTVYIVNDAAGLPVREQAATVERTAKRLWGDNYVGLSASRPLQWLQWLFGVWHAAQGDTALVRHLQRALTDEATESGDPVTRLYAEALAAHQHLAAGDTAGAIARFGALAPTVPYDSLTWSMAMPLPIERLTLARLLLQRGDHAAALRVATVFDQPEPMVYVAFLPASLTIRLRAAEALGWREQATSYRSRLERLQRHGRPRSP